VRGKGDGALEAVQQTYLTNAGSYQAVWQGATIESARRQASQSVDKIEGPVWQQPTNLTNAGSYQAV